MRMSAHYHNKVLLNLAQIWGLFSCYMKAVQHGELTLPLVFRVSQPHSGAGAIGDMADQISLCTGPEEVTLICEYLDS
ncbi:hypothetical protein CEXT_504301 [Caerostris extrusa]|uniref:Uncharacterized protein n=1 Tax=Caerostris extrusa TaxID=172846 RepID=A0AAV4SFC8_CAEEX|nr:hypothetical protein CEXT_504301 [Caerostris extrusa]